MFVADSGNHVIRAVGVTGDTSTFAGVGGVSGWKDDPSPNNALFNAPASLLCGSGSSSVHVFVLESGNGAVRAILNTPGSRVITLAGSGGSYAGTGGTPTAGFMDSPSGTSAAFHSPLSMTLARDPASGDEYLFIADTFNYRVRRVHTISFEVTTIAGHGIGALSGSATDGADFRDDRGTLAGFKGPSGITYDASQKLLYVSDAEGGNRLRRVKVWSSLGVDVSTAAGNGWAGRIDGSGAGAAQFFGPRGIISDGTGWIYVADQWNNAIRAVYCIPPTLSPSPSPTPGTCGQDLHSHSQRLGTSTP